jgi:hypothetical protein
MDAAEVLCLDNSKELAVQKIDVNFIIVTKILTSF